MEARIAAADPPPNPLIRKMRTKFPIWVLWRAADNAYNSSYEKMYRSYDPVRKITPKPSPARQRPGSVLAGNRPHRAPAGTSFLHALS